VFSEDLLQFIWQFAFIEKREELKTTAKESVTIISQGIRNTNAGPDFLNAKIKIGTTTWVGNVELHLKASDWTRHHHEANPTYQKLILHVVYENDVPLDVNFPTLELRNHIRPSMLHRYEELMRIDKNIACKDLIKEVNQLRCTHMLERVLAERFIRKTALIKSLLNQSNNHWEHVLYVLMAKGFGMHINQEAFEKLAILTPLKILAKHKDNLNHIEAILFGQAGLLDSEPKDAYQQHLKRDYVYFKKLYGLQQIAPLHFKFSRLRPANFPTIRLAQFAALLHSSKHLFSTILETADYKSIAKLLQVQASDYWRWHYQFGEASSQDTAKKLGNAFVEILLINTIIPVLFVYGKEKGENKYCNKALRWLDGLKPEVNTETKAMEDVGFINKTAKDSQALLELKSRYCDSKQCLQCGIGYAILN